MDMIVIATVASQAPYFWQVLKFIALATTLICMLALFILCPMRFSDGVREWFGRVLQLAFASRDLFVDAVEKGVQLLGAFLRLLVRRDPETLLGVLLFLIAPLIASLGTAASTWLFYGKIWFSCSVVLPLSRRHPILALILNVIAESICAALLGFNPVYWLPAACAPVVLVYYLTGERDKVNSDIRRLRPLTLKHLALVYVLTCMITGSLGVAGVLFAPPNYSFFYGRNWVELLIAWIVSDIAGAAIGLFVGNKEDELEAQIAR